MLDAMIDAPRPGPFSLLDRYGVAMAGGGKSTTVAQVRDRLRDDILSGYFEPGARLTVAVLTDRYGTSAMPVRAALQELQGLGLVTATPHQGARVRAVDAAFVSNIYELRSAVLAILLPRCVRHVTDAGIEEIEALQERLEQACADGDTAAALQINRRFHHTIHRLAGNPEALDVMERTWLPIDALRSTFGFGDGRLADANASHRALIAALRRRDAAACVEIAQASAARAERDLIARLAQATPRGAPAARRSRAS